MSKQDDNKRLVVGIDPAGDEAPSVVLFVVDEFNNVLGVIDRTICGGDGVVGISQLREAYLPWKIAQEIRRALTKPMIFPADTMYRARVAIFAQRINDLFREHMSDTINERALLYAVAGVTLATAYSLGYTGTLQAWACIIKAANSSESKGQQNREA